MEILYRTRGPCSVYTRITLPARTIGKTSLRYHITWTLNVCNPGSISVKEVKSQPEHEGKSTPRAIRMFIWVDA